MPVKKAGRRALAGQAGRKVIGRRRLWCWYEKRMSGEGLPAKQRGISAISLAGSCPAGCRSSPNLSQILPAIAVTPAGRRKQ